MALAGIMSGFIKEVTMPVKIPSELQEFLKGKQGWVATAARDGTPNVSIKGSLRLIDDEHLIFSDIFSLKTRKNLQENPKGCLFLWGPETKGCLKLKLKVIVHTSGQDFEKMKEMVKAKRAELVCKALLECKIVGVFNCKSGPTAGDKLL